jgi:RND family efflux transporter MFP subunit
MTASRSNRRPLLPASLLALATLAGCSAAGTAKNGGGGEEAPVPSVAVARVETGTLDREITLPGSVRAYQEATLYAKVAGYLERISVDRGDRVRAGQVLAELEVPEIEAEIGKLRAELEAAGIEKERLTRAADRAPDLVTPQAVDTANATYTVALASLKRTETLLAYAKLTAPFSGVVTKRWVDPGAFVPAATSSRSGESAAVVTLMDFSRVRVDVAMPESEVPLVRAGLPVTVTVRDLPGQAFEGTVTRLAYALDVSTRTMGTEIELANPDGVLRPGMYASVRIGLHRRNDVLLVPAEAVLREQGEPFAFTVEDGRARKVALQLGLDDGIRIEVKQGLEPRDVVVVAGAQSLRDGQACRAVERP